MNPDQILARLKQVTSALSVAQLVTLGLTFVAVVGLVTGSAYWLNSSSYRILYADMDPETAAEIVAQLRTRDVPFRLDEGGRTVRVPSTQIDELRLDLDGQGLPASGRIGFEIFDRTAFGVTEFLEHVNYRRALEGEIARTISTLSEVSSARVHIALAKPSLFTTRAEPAKASVVLKLKGSRGLSQATVTGISNLIAASVEGLRPEAVVLLDSVGNSLAQPVEDDEPLGNAQLERQRRLESDLSTRVVSLLEPVVGPNRVRVDVSARLIAATEEQTEEFYDPETVVRSRQVSTEVGTPRLPVGGISGARANSPPEPGDDGVAVQPASPPEQAAVVTPPSRGTETTNYEVSKVVRHTVRPRGEIDRLSVAVIVDDEQQVETAGSGEVTRSTTPRTPEQLEKIEGLVAAAVGLDPARGDTLTVENIAFDMPEIEEPAPPSAWQVYGPQVLDAARIAAVLLLGVLTFLFVVRPIVRRAVVALPSGQAQVERLPNQLPRTVQEVEGDLEAELDAVAGSQRKLPILTKRLTEMTTKSPDSAARLIRTWLAEEEQ